MNQEMLQLAITQRDEEIAQYQVNIDNYTLMLEQLPSIWPDELLQFKGADAQTLINQLQDENTIMLVSDLNFRDRLTATLLTEKIEQRKSILVRTVLQQQLPTE